MVVQYANNITESIRNYVSGKLISLKVDIATRLNRSIFGINIQYIKNGELHIKTLEMPELLSLHTSEYLKEMVGKVVYIFEDLLTVIFIFYKLLLHHFNIIYFIFKLLNILKKYKIKLSPVYSVSCDNGRNMVKMVDFMNEHEIEIDELDGFDDEIEEQDEVDDFNGKYLQFKKIKFFLSWKYYL